MKRTWIMNGWKNVDGYNFNCDVILPEFMWNMLKITH